MNRFTKEVSVKLFTALTLGLACMLDYRELGR